MEYFSNFSYVQIIYQLKFISLKGRECCSEESITYHYVKPKLMYTLYDLYKEFKINKSEKKFKELYDVLKKSIDNASE